MKKLTVLLLSLSMILTLSACGSQSAENNIADTQTESESTEVSAETSSEVLTEAGEEASAEADTEVPVEDTTEADAEDSAEDTESAEGKTLVVYYSATGNTEEAANYITAATGADTLELVPAEPYTEEDLDYNDKNSRVVYEHDNPDEREVELVESTVDDWESYDTVFIGYPIWWGIAAWPVDTFIEANDFTWKTVIPFCTSASSDLGESGELLAKAAGTGDWLEGMRFSSRVSEEDVQEWLEGLEL